MVGAALKAAFERTESEVVGLAAKSSYMSDELKGFRRLSRMSFYAGVSPVWLMAHGERAAISMLTTLIKPKIVIEIGTRFGGSAFLFSETAERVICIDIDSAVRDRTAGVSNIEVTIGDSADEIPKILSDLRRNGDDFDLALIDGDHSAAGVRADIEAFIASRPTRPCWLILHDTFNPTVREGIRSVDWDKPWVSQVEIDFVPGDLKKDPAIFRQMWGGIGVVELQPTDRSEPLIVNEASGLLYEAALRRSSHAANAVNQMRRIARHIKRRLNSFA
jgi:hypothetical protein